MFEEADVCNPLRSLFASRNRAECELNGCEQIRTLFACFESRRVFAREIKQALRLVV